MNSWKWETSNNQYCQLNIKEIADGGVGSAKNGIVCDFNEGPPSATNKKYLTQFDGNKWFLPYRNLNALDDPYNKFVSGFGASRRIEMRFTTDSGEKRALKVIFPHATFGDYITESQLKKSFASLKSLVEKANNMIGAAKSGLMSEITNLTQNNGNLEASKQGGANFKSRIETQKNLEDANSLAIKSKEDQIITLSTNEEKAFLAYTDAKTLKIAKQAEIAALTTTNNNIRNAVLTLENSGSDNQKTIDSFTKAGGEIKSRINEQGVTLKRLAIKQGANIDNAVASAKLAEKDITQASLNLFRPKN